MIEDSITFQNRLDKQFQSFQTTGNGISTLVKNLQEKSSEFEGEMRQYKTDWMNLLDLKMAEAKILWCPNCYSVQQLDGSKYLYTQHIDSNLEEETKYLLACEDCAKTILDKSPWFGEWDTHYKKQPLFKAYEVKKREDGWYLMNFPGGTEISNPYFLNHFKGYNTEQANPDQAAINALANHLDMPPQVEIAFGNKIYYSLLRTEKVEAATA